MQLVTSPQSTTQHTITLKTLQSSFNSTVSKIILKPNRVTRLLKNQGNGWLSSHIFKSDSLKLPRFLLLLSLWSANSLQLCCEMSCVPKLLLSWDWNTPIINLAILLWGSLSKQKPYCKDLYLVLHCQARIPVLKVN